MKRIAFILSIVLISLFSICNAQTSESPAGTMARQFGLYAAYGDAMKATLTVTPETDMTSYVNQLKDEIDLNGGLEEVKILKEKAKNQNEMHVTLAYVCKKEGVVIERTYTLLKVNDTWKIATDKL
jgi:hypothetical protein